MSKRVSNKRGTRVGARSWRTSIRAHEAAYKRRQRAAAEHARLNPDMPYKAPQAVRLGLFRRMGNWIKKQFHRRATYA